MTTAQSSAVKLEPALWAVYLGGDVAPGRMGEDHEVVFVVAVDIKAARRLARAKWRGHGRAHIDSAQRLDRIDGHAITLIPAEPGDATELDGTYKA
jgi:hypothetical protein